MAFSFSRNKILTEVKRVAEAIDNSVEVVSTYNPTPASLPSVWVREIGNDEYATAVTLDATDSQYKSTYEVQVSATSMTRAYVMIDAVNMCFKRMNFIRDMCYPIDSEDKTVYRIVARYHRAIGAGDMMPL